VPADRCVTFTTGTVEDVPGQPPVTMMHAALIPNTDKVLFWGYHTPIGQSRIWDPAGGPGLEYVPPTVQLASVAPLSPPAPVPELSSNMHSAGHAYLDDVEGTLLAHGGESWNEEQSFLFHPATMAWERTATTQDGRFYPTSLTLADGRILTLFGSHLPALVPSRSIEIYNPGSPGTWDPPIGLPAAFDFYFYPWTYLLPGGDLFVAGHEGVTVRFAWTPAVTTHGTWSTVNGERSTGGELGTSVLLPLRPPFYEPRVLIAGGTGATAQTAELIDLSVATPAWTSIANLNRPRPAQVQTVMLPDGRVFLVGGVAGSDGGTAGPSEIFDPQTPAAGWELGPMMHYARGYHSSAILLSDGSVLMGGDPPSGGMPTPHERYYPSYCFKPRPVIDSAPASAIYGGSIDIDTHQAPSIKEVVLLRPGAVTHGFNQSQRFVGCGITHNTATQVTVDLPPDGNIAPPGYYLLFVVDANRVPSKATWIRLHH
jgi:hypothetical protein